jgi:hypothetical protein
VSGGLTYGDLAVGGGVQVALGADYGLEKYWISRDGARFTPASPPCPEGTVASLADVRVQRVVALCSGSAGSPQPGSMERQLWRAPHLGAAFTGTSAAPAAGIHQGFAAATAEVATVAAEGGDTAFLHSTFDGGRTWTTTVLGQDRFGITDLAFPAGGTGVVIFGQPDAAGGSALYRTTDGGRSWPEVRFG